MAKQEAIQDNNQFPALIAHSGTAGTADTIRLVATAAGKLQVESAAEVTVGTIQRINTIGTLEVGTVTIGAVNSVGTLASGTITRLEGGTVGLVTRVSTIGTLEVGTIATLPNIPGGTITRVSTLGTLEVGTISALPNTPGGTLGLVTTVSNLTNGSVAVTAGTITNLLKTEDVAHSTGDAGVMPLAVRVDGGTSLVGTDLDYAPLQVDAAGALRISGTVATGAGTQAVRIIDGTVTSVTDVANLAKGTITKVEGGTVGLITRVGNVGTLEVGTISTLPNTPGGTLGLVTTVTTVSNVSAGSVAVTAGTITNLLKAEDAGHSTGDSGVMSMAVRNDGGTSLAGTDLDYVPLTTDANGALRISGTVATGAGTQPVRVIDGTVTSVSDVANLAKGTITRLEGGTLGLVTTVSNLSAGSVAVIAGTITDLLRAEDAGHTSGDSGVMAMAVRNDNGTSLVGANLDYIPLTSDANGALRTTGTVTMISAGTITKVEGGTVDLVTTVSNLTSGSVRMTVGTLTVMPNVPGGTLGLVTSVTEVANLAKGTITRVEGGTLGVVSSVTDVANLAKGTVTRLEGGTLGLVTAVTTVSNVSAGSIAVVAGTVSTGTIVNNGGTQGKFDPKPNRNVLNYSTTTTGTVGTLVAAPSAGSSVWVTSLDISVQSGTVEPLVSFNLATNGQGVLNRGNYVAGGGIAKTYTPATNANNTGTALTFNILSGAGTVSYNVGYFVDVP